MNDLDQYTEQALTAVSPLMAKSTELLKMADTQAIADDADLRDANSIKKQINAHNKAVKDLRLNLTRPVDEFKRRVMDKENEILKPLEDAKRVLGNKILAYEEELEQQRQAEEKRIDEMVDQVRNLYRPGMTAHQVGTGRTAAKALMAELGDDANIPRVKLALVELSNRFAERLNDIEIEEQRQKKQKIEADAAKLEDERRQLAAREARQEAERQAIEDQKAAARAVRDRPKSNIVELYDFEIINPGGVDRAYCSPDEKKIRAFIADHKKEIDEGATLAGIRIFKTKKVR